MKRFLLLAYFLCAPLSLKAAQLHAFLVGDTFAENLEHATAVDIANVRARAAIISMFTDLKLHEIVLQGQEVTPNNFYAKINDLKCDPNDVILFYFTGHGFRTNSKGGNPWPNMFFSLDRRGIDYQHAVNLLKTKNARLLVAIADCCNNILADHQAPNLIEKSLLKASKKNRTKTNYCKLFLETKGVIMTSSSKPGQFSWAYESMGGVYTIKLLSNMAKEVRDSKDISWNTILDKAAHDVNSHQTPQYVISK